MSTRVTRRQLVGIIAGAAPVLAQSTPQPETDEQTAAQAVERVKAKVGKLRAVKVPIVVEPAFAFRAQ